MKTKLTIFTLFAFLIINANSQSFTQIMSGTILGEESGRNYDCAWGDFNNDGFADLYVVNNFAGHLNYLYKNNGDETFTQITEGEIVTDGGTSYACSWGDYDNDGNLDLFVCNYNANNGLYKNNGDETFTKITTGAIVTNGGKSACADWGDYDNDGNLDLYVINRDQQNFLYHNNGDETFTKITSGIIVTESKNSGAGAWGDYNGDGYLDMFVANAGPAYNSLFRNNGDGTFIKVEEEPFTTDFQSFDCVSWGDIDNDGDLDLFTAPGMLPNNFDLYLYKNNGDGSFTKIPNLPQAGINSGGGCSMNDYDNDGDLDIFVIAYDGNNVILDNDGFGNFSQNTSCEIATVGGYCKDPSWADYNNNGQSDLYIPLNNYFGGYNIFFENNGNSNSWIEIKCEGTISNSFGIGAVVSVFTTVDNEVVEQTRIISNQQKNLLAHFGLGDVVSIDSIIVTWPASGIIDILEEVSINQLITVIEGETTSINKNSANSIAVYPNPANCYVNITDVDNSLISICNSNGRVLKTFESSSQNCRVNVSNLASGVYFIKIIKEKNITIKKIIIQ